MPKKSERKTAELFKAPLASLCKIKNIKEVERINSFAKNFGIAFQIKDDLLNILETDKTKPIMSDIHNGIYTAPVLYLSEDVKNLEELNELDIIKLIQADKKYVQRTVNLIKEYADRAIESIDFVEENEYKKKIVNITQNLYKAGISG